MIEATQAYDSYNVFYTAFGCSRYAELFVCLSLAPQCLNNTARPPCASFCDIVKAQCNDAILHRGGFGFDVHCLLDCSRQVAVCAMARQARESFMHVRAVLFLVGTITRVLFVVVINYA